MRNSSPLNLTLALDLTEWEESFVAALFLAGIPLEEGMIPEERFEELFEALAALERLPPTWSAELALEALR